MGMFDSIMLNAECPYCKKVSEMEFQTKDTDCNLTVWRVGDYVDKTMKSLHTIADGDCCHKYFNADVFLNNGKVAGKFKVTRLFTNEQKDGFGKQ